LRVHLDAVVRSEGLAQLVAMLGQGGGVGVAELVQQPRRSLDVGEEEGDGS
jgi:glucokinase